MATNDITPRVIAQQIEALDHPNYEIGVFDPRADRMLIRTWSKEKLVEPATIGYLRAQNSHGCHIYIRPVAPHPYTLIDDLKTEVVDALANSGLAPVLVLQTSPGNHQVWLRNTAAMPNELATGVAKELAAVTGGDPGSADWRHFGRLAGFTNRKDKYKQADGRFPFVRLVRTDPGHVYDQAEQLVAKVATAQLAALEAQKAARAEWQRLPMRSRHAKDQLTIEDFRHSDKYKGDGHRIDLAYAAYALGHGVPAAEVMHQLRSRDLSHKGNERRQMDYVERTIGKAREAVQQRRGIDR